MDVGLLGNSPPDSSYRVHVLSVYRKDFDKSSQALMSRLLL